MPTNTKTTALSHPAATKPPSKSALVLKLLGRAKGATIAEMEEPTSWQPHSMRAFLSGLRKKGMIIAREPRKTGETAYRIVTAAGSGADAPTRPVADPKAPATASAAEAGVEDDKDAKTSTANSAATKATA